METEDTEERLMEEVAVLDFDMLCAAVALQTQGMNVGRRIAKEENEYQVEVDLGGVQRMWEGDVLGCLEDRRIAMESMCCPCYRFGRNMGRAGLGHCFLQGGAYFILLALALLSLIAFSIIEQHYLLYLGAASAISIGLYAGYFRGRIKKKFNIRGSGSSLEDFIFHLLCPCCTLCQLDGDIQLSVPHLFNSSVTMLGDLGFLPRGSAVEPPSQNFKGVMESRTLEMNNVQDGVWHGRGDAICVGSYGEGSKEFNILHKPPLMPTKNPESCNMERTPNDSGNHSWNVVVAPSESLFLPASQG